MLRKFIFTLYSALILLFIMNELVNFSELSYIVGGLAMITIIIASFYAQGLYLKSGIIFLTIGIILFAFNNLPIQSVFLYFDTMLGMISLFYVLPFINAIIKTGSYDYYLSRLLERNITSVKMFYKKSFIVTHLLSLFLNIATVPLMQNTLENSLKKTDLTTANKFYTQNLLRAYALCITWSPLEIMVILSLDLVGYSYFTLFPFISFFALIMIMCDWLLIRKRYSDIQIEGVIRDGTSFNTVYIKIIQMLFMLFSMVLMASYLETALGNSFLFAIVLLIIPVSVFWAFLIGKTTSYFAFTIPDFYNKTLGLSNFFFIFLSAGFFVEMVSYTPVISWLMHLFSQASEIELFLFILISLYFIITTFIGFHPLVSITLLSQILAPLITEIASISLVLVLITSSLATTMYGPFNISVSLLASQLKLNPYRISYWNFPFALLYMTISIIFAYVLTFF